MSKAKYLLNNFHLENNNTEINAVYNNILPFFAEQKSPLEVQ